MKKNKYAKFRAREIARKLEAIRTRLICVLRHEPGDYHKRICPVCKAEVISYCCRPARKGQGGTEVIRCERGHFLHPEQWETVEN